MTSLLVLSWAARGGGRARALLSLADYCQAAGIDVTVVTGTASWSRDRLAAHHDVAPPREWTAIGWRGAGKSTAAAHAVASVNPDVVLAFDTLLVKACRTVDRPVIGYLRTTTVPGVDEYWAPSKATARDHTETLREQGEPRCRAVYPTWYVDEPAETPSQADRPIDVLIHGRKSRGTVAGLNPDYNLLLANRFTYAELRAMYRQTKLFVFPRPARIEPLGLMPIEAAAEGCRVAVPTNSGVAETMPEHAYDHPTEHVGELLARDGLPSPSVPESPTDPADRISALT